MINSFRRMRTGKPDGSGRKRTGDGEADGSGGSCSGCSAVRAPSARALLPMAIGERKRSPHRSRISAAALLPMAIGEPKRSPHRSRSSSFLFLVLLFLRLSPVGGSGWKPSHRRGQNPPSCAAKTAAGGSAGRAPAARRQSPPLMARSSSPAARRQSPPALQDVVQLDTAAGMRLFSALQETNPPPWPQE